MAKNAGEGPFFEMLRALALAIGWLFSAFFSLLGLLVDELTGHIRNSQQQKRQAQEREKAIAGPHGATSALEAQAASVIQQAAFPTADQFLEAFFERYVNDHTKDKRFAAWGVRHPMLVAAYSLYAAESFDRPPSRSVVTGEIEAGQYRDALIAYAKKLSDPGKSLATMTRCMIESCNAMTKRLPSLALQGFDEPDVEPDEAMSIPFIDLVHDPKQIILESIFPYFAPDAIELGLFKTLRKQLEANRERAEHELTDHSPPREVVSAFLKNTELEASFNAKVPFTISIPKRLEHTAIIAGTGWGKTQLLQSIIVKDLEDPDPPSIVVIDSTNRMVERLQRLSLFNERLKDRIIIIDPERSPSPALNMFDINTPRMLGYTSDMREQVETDIIDLFNYVFSSIQNPLTDPMRTVLSYMVRLLITIPDANITKLRNLLEENPKEGYQASTFKKYIDKLDPTAIDYFKYQFFTDRTAPTRSAILQRVSSLIRVPAFERMFSTVNRLDFFEEMQRGSCILVNTSEAKLKDASALFGRYIIARVMAAAFERAALPDEKRKPTFLIVDEAAPYFDDRFEKLLTRVRQFKLGIIIAFQHVAQADTGGQKLRSAIASNTTVKYAGGLGYDDSRWLGREMRTTPEALLALQKDGAEPPQFTNYACHVKGMDRAINIRIPFYSLENMPKMTEQEHAQLLERNRQRTAYAPAAPPATPQSAEMPAPPLSAEHHPKSYAANPPTGVPTRQSAPAADDPHTGDHTEPASKWGDT